MTLSRLLLLAATVVLSLLAGGVRAADTTGSDNGRDLVLRYLQQIDCAYAARAALPENNARFETSLREHMPPAQHAAERAARQEVVARRSIGCEGLAHQVRDVSVQFDARTVALQKQAALAGDRYARLNGNLPTADDPAAVARMRMQLREIVQSGDLLAISEIGRPIALSRDPGLYGSATRAGDGAVIDTWMLVACDLGLECGSGSRPLDRWCLKMWGCAQTDLAGAIRAVHGQAYFLKIDAQRRSLVVRIRNQQWEGLFAPLADTAGPGTS